MDEVPEIVGRYPLALAKVQTLIELHRALGLENASPDLIEAGREVQRLNARALEFVDRPEAS